MLDAAFAVPGDIDAPTGGYAYARKLFELLPALGVALRHVELPGGFPHPSEAELADAARRLRTAAPAVYLIDGLAYGAMRPELLAGFAAPIVALVHHPLGFETGLSPARRDELLKSEAAALELAARVISSSKLTARVLASEFGVPREKIEIAEPGTEAAPRARGTGRPVSLLAVGAISPRKAYADLVHALAGVKNLDWRLTIVGSRERSPETVRSLERAILESGLNERIELTGAIADTRLDGIYDAADVFVSPSLFEGYGMVLTEAMARGLPLILSTGGAAIETVPDEAGLKVPPGERIALREALRQIIGDAGLRQRLAEGSWQAGQRLPRWSDTAAKVAAVLREAAR